MFSCLYCPGLDRGFSKGSDVCKMKMALLYQSWNSRLEFVLELCIYTGTMATVVGALGYFEDCIQIFPFDWSLIQFLNWFTPLPCSFNLNRWMEACITEELPPTTELEEGLRNGVYLGKLAHFYAPKKVPYKRIYDKDQTRYKVSFTRIDW